MAAVRHRNPSPRLPNLRVLFRRDGYFRGWYQSVAAVAFLPSGDSSDPPQNGPGGFPTNQSGEENRMIRQGATTAKRFRPVVLALMILGMAGLIAGTFALYGSVSAGSSGLISDTVMVMDLNDHGGVGVMNPQARGTSDLVRSAGNYSEKAEGIRP